MKKFYLFLSVMILAFIAFADMGGPDAFGYYWHDNSEPEVTYDWIDPTGGTEVIFSYSDDEYATVPLPFSVNFYGISYSDDIYISTNGLVAFDPDEADEYMNDSIPTSFLPNNIICPFWDDLRGEDSSHVFYETIGTAPDRVFVVSWYDWFHYGTYTDPEDKLAFQVKIFESEGAVPNDIVFQYKDPYNSDLAETRGAEATIGIENNTGIIGLQVSYNTAILDSGYAILFTKPVSSGYDIAALSVVNPASPAMVSIPQEVKMVVSNYGALDTDDVPVIVNILSSMGDTVYHEMEEPDIAAGLIDTITFPDWTPAIAGTFHVYLEVDFPSDTISVNDTLSREVVAWSHISSGGPDLFGNVWYDSYHPSGPSYVSVPTDSGIVLDSLMGDDEIFQIELPFTFPFYGEDFEYMWISTNGYLSFDSTMAYSHTFNDSIPRSDTPNAVIAPFWDDSDVDNLSDSSAAILYYEESPNVFWIIWRNIFLPYSSTSEQVTYGVRLSMNGLIEFHYLDATTPGEPEHSQGMSATVGIESPDGSDGLLYEFNGMPPANLLYDHFAIRFTPPSVGPDTTGPFILHTPSATRYADPPDWCVVLAAQMNDISLINAETLYISSPISVAVGSDSSVGNVYYFTACGLLPGDTVEYHFSAQDSLGNFSLTPEYSMRISDPHRGGPDATGYHFIDSWAVFDSTAPEEVYWYEMNPDSGGSGTELALGITGLSGPVEFGFTFPFYGILSGGIVVSEDGWLCMDTSASLLPVASPPDSFPNSDDPYAVVAPFWTDLEPSTGGMSGGGVYYGSVYDSTDGIDKFVIQWDMYSPDVASPELLRFQAIFFDVAEGSYIIISLRNIESAIYDECAIAIEDELGTDGLAYWYKGEPDGASIPKSGSCVLFYHPTLNDISEKSVKPEKFDLRAYPNPFNSAVSIEIYGVDDNAELDIFDINGRTIRGYELNSKSNKIIWNGMDSDGGNCPSGIYFARVSGGNKHIVKRLMLIR